MGHAFESVSGEILGAAVEVLKSSKIPVGLILNLGKVTLDSRRVVR